MKYQIGDVVKARVICQPNYFGNETDDYLDQIVTSEILKSRPYKDSWQYLILWKYGHEEFHTMPSWWVMEDEKHFTKGNDGMIVEFIQCKRHRETL